MLLELGSKNYSCAQILLIAALRLQGRENPELIRAMSGLAEGGGGSGNTCGAFTGGACLLSLYSAKGENDEMPLENHKLLMEAFSSWFQESFCANNPHLLCDSLLGANGASGAQAMPPRQCAAMIAQVWEKAIELLCEYGLDPTDSKARA